MAKVLYAEKYARMLFDRELHDALLQQVVAADTSVDNQNMQNSNLAMDNSETLTLINTLAKQKAAVLLKNADEYF